jgi:hypothetical protein
MHVFSFERRSRPALKSKLSLYSDRLDALREDVSTLSSFLQFFKHGITHKEVITLDAVQRLIKEHVLVFAGDIASDADDWRKYLQDGDDSFYPSRFLKPLREKLQSALASRDVFS